MRIALDGIPLLSAKTGVGKYTFELAAALKRLPGVLDVSLFYGIHWSMRLRRNYHLDNGVGNSGLQGSRIARRVPDTLKGWLRRKATRLEFAIHRPDIFHATNYVADPCDVPMVVTVHDLSFYRYPETQPPERLNWLSEGLLRTLNQAKGIITDSQFTKDELISLLGVPGNRINVVHLGVTANYRPRDKDVLAEKLREFDLAPKSYILSVGTLEPRKNISKLLRAYELLPDSLKEQWPLVIAGMRGWKDQEITKRMEKLARNGKLRPLGYVPDDKLPLIYAGATLFVYPSLYEGFGLPALEAMASGVPVIVSNRASLPEVVGEAGALIDPEDIESLAHVIESLLLDQAKREQMAMAGLQQAKRFTWEACAKKTFRIYQRVLEQDGA